MKKSKLALKIEKSNKQFVNATKAQKRVMIAKDVIMRINSKQYVPLAGTYVELYANDYSYDAGQFIHEGGECTVCAKGGILMSLIGFVDGKTVGDVDSSVLSKGCDLFDDMTTVFSEKQLTLIETAFEGCVIDDGISDKEEKKSVKAFDKYYSDNKRLVAIMKNIVKNNGTFKP